MWSVVLPQGSAGWRRIRPDAGPQCFGYPGRILGTARGARAPRDRRHQGRPRRRDRPRDCGPRRDVGCRPPESLSGRVRKARRRRFEGRARERVRNTVQERLRRVSTHRPGVLERGPADRLQRHRERDSERPDRFASRVRRVGIGYRGISRLHRAYGRGLRSLGPARRHLADLRARGTITARRPMAARSGGNERAARICADCTIRSSRLSGISRFVRTCMETPRCDPSRSSSRGARAPGLRTAS